MMASVSIKIDPQAEKAAYVALSLMERIGGNKSRLESIAAWLSEKLEADIKLNLEVKEGFNGSSIKIESDDIMGTAAACSPIDRAMYESVHVEFWGGRVELEPQTPYIFFMPHIRYKLKSGGYNACEIFNPIKYDYEKDVLTFN